MQADAIFDQSRSVTVKRVKVGKLELRVSSVSPDSVGLS